MTAQSSVPFGARSNICRLPHFHRRPRNKILRAKIKMLPSPTTKPRYDFCRTTFALAPPTTQLRREWFFKRTFRPAQSRSFDTCSNRCSPRQTWRVPSDSACSSHAGIATYSPRPPKTLTRTVPIGDRLCRRGCTGLENVQRLDAARCTVAGDKDRICAAVNRSDNHEVVGQMETFDAEIRMPLAN